jgi:hypothetical protein
VQRWLCFVVVWTLFSFPIYLGKVDGYQFSSCADGVFLKSPVDDLMNK